MYKSLLIIVLFITLDLYYAQTDNPLVITPLGPLRGKRYEFKSKFNQRSINAFIGVPYAKPPVGDYRFKLPQPMDSWKTEKDVTDNRVMCPQVNQRFKFNLSQEIREDEDCLYLNIFTPLSSRPTNGFPVMVYLHPGQFQFSGKDFYGPEYLLDNDIILVTINYRLGVLGFLTTDDESSPGNYGIHDQIAALKWVSVNIELFGGYSKNITVFGHDSGAISASILLISSQSWGLFHNVMILGGSVFTPKALRKSDLKNTIDFARLLNCNIENLMFEQNSNNFTLKLIDCLRKKSVQELMSISRLPGLYPNTYQFNFGPVIDNNVSKPLIVDWPIRLFKLGNYWKIPLVGGINLNEGSLDYFLHYDRIRNWPIGEKLFYIFSQYQFDEFYTKLLYKSVDWFYYKRFNESNQLNNNRINYPFYQNNNLFPQNQNKDSINQLREEQTLIDSMGDFLFGSANTLLLDVHSLNSKYTYLYTLEHKGLKSFGPLQLNGSQSIHRDQYGVTHMDDIFYLFPTLYNNDTTSSYDEPIIKTMCQHFTYFAKYGKFAEIRPISSYQVVGSNWFPYSRENPYYLKFNSQYPQTSQAFRSEFLSFWNYFIREIFDETYSGNTTDNQISASFIGTVQLSGLIKFGDKKFIIS